MLGLLGSKFGAYLIIAIILTIVIGGAFMHMRAAANTIIQLNQQVSLLAVQAKDLQAANDAMRADIANVQQAQASANAMIEVVRQQAVTATQVVRSRTFTIGAPTAIQLQINKETSDRFKRLEAVSRAP